jgi:hypothetical protein
MKKIISLLVLLINLTVMAQKECEYSSNVTDSLGTYKSTKDYMMHERVFAGNQTLIYFSLINADGLLSLGVQIIQKSEGFVKANCFDKNSKIYLQLANGKIISLIGIELDTCGNAFRVDNTNSRILSGYFLFVKDSFEDLKKSPISLMRIKFGTETVDYVIKEKLTSEVDKNTYFPENYFINYLKCIE